MPLKFTRKEIYTYLEKRKKVHCSLRYVQSSFTDNSHRETLFYISRERARFRKKQINKKLKLMKIVRGPAEF